MKHKFGKSISAKLNIWYTLLMFVLSVGLIFSVVTAARMAQNSQVQQELVRSVERNIDEIEVENGLLDIESDFAYTNGNTYAVVFSEDGKILGGEYPESFTAEIPLSEKQFEKYDGFYVYDTKVQFTKYDYKIDGEDGEIISSEVEGADYYTPFEGTLDFYGDDCEISCREAFTIAVKKSGLNPDNIEIINVKNYEYNDDPIYEVEFYSTEKAFDDIWVRGVTAVNGVDGVWAVLIRLALILLPIILVLSVLVGRVITKRALQPVKLLSEAVEETHDEKDLTKRIRIDDGDPLITGLAENFNEMFRRLQLSFQTERQFSGDVSHELRTPTAVILAECEYQLSRDELDSEDRESFETIEKQAQAMKQLISQLLEITKMEQNSTEQNFEKEDLSLLVNAVCDDAEALSQKGITLTRDIDENVELPLDIMLMTRLVTNLVSNAYQYGKENGNIKVSLRKEKGRALLSVADDGIGIDKEHQDKIWNRFYRVDKARCREEGCSGLGLAMVKQIALMHGGDVSLQSEIGKGSIFTVDLPME